MKKLKTLLIGINDYPGAPLSGCIRDVEKMHSYFDTLTSDFPDGIEQVVLTDKLASKEPIVSKLDEAIRSLNDGDTFVFYFSGHGTREISEGRFKDDHNGVLECIVPWQSGVTNGHSLLADKELRYLLNQCIAKAHIVTIFDSCHSGDVTRGSADSRVIKRLGYKFPQRKYEDFIFSSKIPETRFKDYSFDEVIPDKNFITLSACQPYESSWEKGGSGVFTRNLLSVLENYKNVVNYGDLTRNVEISIRYQTKEKQAPALSVSGEGNINQLTSWLGINGNRLKSDAGYITYNQNENLGWIYSRGELMGMKKGSNLKLIIDSQVLTLTVKKVNLNDSLVEATDEILQKLDAAKIYAVNSVDFFSTPRISINNIDHDKVVEKALTEQIKANAHIEAVGEWENADFEIVIFNQTIYYTFPNDPYRPLNEQVNLLNENGLDTFLKKIDDDFKILSRWRHYHTLEKNEGFASIPIKVEIKLDSTWYDITNCNYSINTGVQRSANGQFRTQYQIKITNQTTDRLYITPIVLFRGCLEISSYPFKNSSTILESGRNQIFGNYIKLDDFQEIYNWPFEEACFKFIVSTVSDLGLSISDIIQTGFKQPQYCRGSEMSTERGGGGSSEVDHQKERWAIYTSSIKIMNPTLDQISGALLRDMGLYQENDVLSPFIERLYFNLDDQNISNKLVGNRDAGERSLKIWVGNTIDTVRRNRLFKKQRKRYPDKPIVVAEGDSWFLYPILVKDTIDYLMDSWSVKSLAWAGDTLENYKKSGQLLREIKDLSPKYVALSGGGNDIIGADIKSLLIKNAKEINSPRDYLNNRYEDKMKTIAEIYTYFFNEIDRFPSVEKILVHGYDYIRSDHAKIVTKGGWLNRYLVDAGLTDAGERARLIKFLIDGFNELLIDLSSAFDKVIFIDLRNKIDRDQWYDEIHPNDIGYKKVADAFEEAINS